MTDSDNLSIYDFGKICRTCLKEVDNLKPLYETCSKQTCLIEMLMSCTLIRLSENDGLPVQVCLKCIQEINQAYLFAKKCEKSDSTLRKCISQFQNKLCKRESRAKKLKSKSLRQTRTKKEIVVEEQVTAETKEEEKETKVEEAINIEKTSQKLYDNELSDNADEIYEDVPEREIKLEECELVEVPLKKLSRLKSATPYECKKCFEKFPNYQLLKLHRDEVKHPPNIYNRKVCEICNKSIGYSRMSEHMRIHTCEKPYCCEVCGARFTIRSNLRRHTLSHSSVKPYKCDQCEKGFTRLGLLKDHQRIHTGERPFVCNFCGKSFPRNSAFRAHLFRHAQKGETTGQIKATDHQCVHCQRCFASKQLLKAHLVIHGEKKFLCSDCGKGFVSMILLKSHSKIHSGVRPYTCQVCGKSFSHIGSLKSHTLIHTGQKPYVCSVCSRAFTQRNHLKYHLRTHSGERPYVCSVCGKSFALNGNLTVHMRTHTGETPFVCPVCGKGFHDSSSMKKHKKGHATPNVDHIVATATEAIIEIPINN